MSIKEIKKKINPILKRNGVKRAAIFGSYARGDQKKKSDIDIWVELDDEKSLFDLFGLQLELEKKMKKKIDLGEYCTIRPRIKENILREQVLIYEERT
ncbi:MAG: nucleotidyltransferase family protein [Candidatus Staskawiczbacteria bacterium]|nr:nucleotidyltransferase family protein [Candidatus Staskawiczbacteria bacterium]